VNPGQLSSPQDAGFSTLQNLSTARRLNRWMFESIRPFVKGNILEIGSGIGNISECFVQGRIPLSLSDMNEEYCRRLREKFSGEASVKDVLRIDLADKTFSTTYAGIAGSFDTVYALNVIEHIVDDRLAVANCKALLAPGGQLILLVPVYPALFSRFDRELGHYRRYTRRSLEKLLSTDFDMAKTWYFNAAGLPGWFLFGSVLRRKVITKGQLAVYDRLVPLFRSLDAILGHRVGLSVIAVAGRK
jgi:SAM-dependent methyltransferase